MADVDLVALLNRKSEVDAQIAALQKDALAELAAAKEAHRAAPTEETWLRKAAAVTWIQRLRGIERADRPGTQVGGDAFVSSDSTVEG